jgi:serine/threonine-protein phosphatase 6 regulatory ankyrin repeat subunit B
VGANVDARDKEGWTALMVAAKRGAVAMVRELLKLGASSRAVRNGRTVLDVAMEEGHVAIALLLSG